jgi:hypothetical protein
MGKNIKVLRSDRGGEYTGNVPTKFFTEKGIRQEVTTADTPEHNGVSEQMNRTLLDKVRTMLADANLPESFWYDALEYAAILHNCLPTNSLPNLMPEEAWSGNKPDIFHLRVFSCPAHMHVPIDHRSKLSSHMQQCVFLGLASNYKAFRLIHRPSHKIYNSCDVIFDEGGPTHECVIIDDDKNNDENDSENNAPAPAPVPRDSPTLESRPKRVTHAPAHNDDHHYEVSVYNR